METKTPEASSKLTLKILGCDPTAVFKAQEKTIPLARIYGKAHRSGVQQDIDRGLEYTFFNGAFEGVNLQDGTFITAPRLYLPGSASDQLEHIIAKAKQRDKAAIVGFALEIRATKSDESTSGYIYDCVFLKKPFEHDELAEFREFAGPAPVQTKTAAAKKSA